MQFIRNMPRTLVKDSESSLRIDTELFLAGDGAAMEEAIQRILDTQFEYETDGLASLLRGRLGWRHLEILRAKVRMRVYKSGSRRTRTPLISS